MKRLTQLFLILSFWCVYLTPAFALWTVTENGITFEASPRVGSFIEIYGPLSNYPVGTDIIPHVNFSVLPGMDSPDLGFGVDFFIAHIIRGASDDYIGALVDEIYREQYSNSSGIHYFWVETSYIIDPDRVVTWAYFAPIPEPSSLFLLCLGLIGLIGIKRKH